MQEILDTQTVSENKRDKTNKSQMPPSKTN